jgi:hypothetical protein
MPQDNKTKTLYEVLGVPRTAKATDIGLAYSRYKSEMQKESAVPDARRAAMMKVAYDTLYDPAKRAEYDATLEGPKKKKGAARAVIIAAVVAAIAGAGAWRFLRPPDKPAKAAALTSEQLLEGVSPFVGRLQSTLMSGEVKPAGVAVATGEGEMITTCHGLPPGAQLAVRLPTGMTKAELARANEELDVCTLKVKEIGNAFAKARGADPGPSEKVYAVVAEGSRSNFLKEARVTRAIADPRGGVLELNLQGALPTGSPVIDSQGRLVGIVTTPHSFGEGLTVALGPTRIAQARAAGAAAAAIASSPVAAPSSPGAVPLPAPRGRGPALVGEGFTTLWKEDSAQRMVEVLDDAKKGQVGVPLAYWTKWTGRDPNRSYDTHCVVTFGDDEEIVVDSPLAGHQFPAEGYWMCALVRFNTELDQLEEGSYHFMMFVDGEKVAENRIRIEKRFFTRGVIAVIVIVVGLGLLGFLRRNKVVSYADAGKA